jgi:multidrug efflux pump
MDLPEGYEAKMTGEQEQQAETGAFLGRCVWFALALMLMIMVVQFNSVVKPLIIFLYCILLAHWCSYWALHFTGMKLQ